MKNYGFRIFAFCLGILLLVLAVFLTLVLFFQLLGIEMQMELLQELGHRLFSFYGTSTFAIPAIILFFAIVLIVPTWNTKLNFICIGTPLYFFTFVFFEHVANFLIIKFNTHNLGTVFNIACFLFALFVIALEITLAILFAEKLSVKELPVKNYDESINIIGASYTGGHLETHSENYSKDFFNEPSRVESNDKENTIRDTFINTPSAELQTTETIPSFIPEVKEVPNIYEYSPNPFEPPLMDAMELEELTLYENEDDFPELPPKPFLPEDEKDETIEIAEFIEPESGTDTIDTINSVANFASQSNPTEIIEEVDIKQNEDISNSNYENNGSSLLASMVVISENENENIEHQNDKSNDLKNNYEDENLQILQNSEQTKADVLTELDEVYESLKEVSNNKSEDEPFDKIAEKTENADEVSTVDDFDEVEIPEFILNEETETNNIETSEVKTEVENKIENETAIENKVNDNNEAENQAEIENKAETENDSKVEIELAEEFNEASDETLVANDLTADDENIYETDEAETSEVQTQAKAKPKTTQDLKAPVAGQPNALRYEYSVPSSLLTSYPDNKYWVVDDETRREARILKETLSEFKIDVAIKDIIKGPVVTMFELMPPPGIKLSKITSLQDNIALRLAAPSVRIVAPIPGKEAVGIEVPNAKRAIVSMRELIEADIPQIENMAIPVLLGKDITGRPQTMDIAQTPHLLIAGATGSGKSVCVNSIILSILYNRTPEQVRLLLVDPKIVELKLYNGIAHLLAPVITEPKKAFQALQYCLCEMERRYALLDSLSVRDIKSYNTKVEQEKLATETIPYIVIIIDEFADLMATTGKELESTVARLCAMSRAVGIHLVLATQRPSINVITGLIKANIPTRIAFMVASNADSRIILDESGAEKLLGKGDMLYVSVTNPFPVRIQGSFASDADVERVVEHIKTLREPDYIEDEIFINDDEQIDEIFIGDSDPLYDKALEIVLLEGKASASYLQRRLKIGYNRAARIVEEMYERGIVGPPNGSKPREVIYNQGQTV
ncbi:MAG: DNA translocase FtsK [Treponemataceae bacterium]